MKFLNVDVLVGETINKIEGLKEGSEEVFVHTLSGKVYKFYHEQDCCEDVRLCDFEIGADDLKGALITSSEEVESEGEDSNWGTSTWTFYKLETTKGELWMRWLGESNGYYGEDVWLVLAEDNSVDINLMPSY